MRTHMYKTDAAHYQFRSIPYVVVKAAEVPDGAAHDYDEISTSGEVCVSKERYTDALVLSTATVSSDNVYCETPQAECENLQLNLTVRVIE